LFATPSAARVTQRQYERIQLGMTPIEVQAVMESRPCDLRSLDALDFGSGGARQLVASEALDGLDLAHEPFEVNASVRKDHAKQLGIGCWLGTDNEVVVFYGDAQVMAKFMYRRISPWEISIGDWSDWLRGLVGL
jgi:hypothetical protein